MRGVTHRTRCEKTDVRCTGFGNLPSAIHWQAPRLSIRRSLVGRSLVVCSPHRHSLAMRWTGILISRWPDDEDDFFVVSSEYHRSVSEKTNVE